MDDGWHYPRMRRALASPAPLVIAVLAPLLGSAHGGAFHRPGAAYAARARLQPGFLSMNKASGTFTPDGTPLGSPERGRPAETASWICGRAIRSPAPCPALPRSTIAFSPTVLAPRVLPGPAPIGRRGSPTGLSRARSTVPRRAPASPIRRQSGKGATFRDASSWVRDCRRAQGPGQLLLGRSLVRGRRVFDWI